MEVALALGLFFILITVIFIAVAVFLPEWVGITGKKAKSVMEEQKEQSPPTDSL
jgi:hypothetical protein